MRNVLILIFSLSFANFSIAQQLSAVLESVAKNNKELYAADKLKLAQEAEALTGLNPDNPAISYGYAPSTNGNGTKETYGISQSFDFPTRYIRKLQTARLEQKEAGITYLKVRQQVLTEGAIQYNRVVFLHRKQQVLEQRYHAMQNIYNALDKQLATGGSNLLEVQKARLELMKASDAVQENLGNVAIAMVNISRLNGGVSIHVESTVYPVWEAPLLDTLQRWAIQRDPQLLSAVNDKAVSDRKLQLARATWFPSFEVGWEGEKNANEGFEGPKVGMTLPLWQNRRTIQTRKAYQASAQVNYDAQTLTVQAGLYAEYQMVQNLKTRMDNAYHVMKNINSEELLQKSFSLGQIGAIEYFRELSWLYEIHDQYLQLERDYHVALAKMYRYTY